MSEVSTKKRILDAAEALFAGKGLDATSLRDITAEAQVNLAAVNYHFGSKDDLIVAVYERRMEPIAQRRLMLLENLLKRDNNPALEDILDAFVRPVIEAGHLPNGSRAPFLPLMGRIWIERMDLMERILRSTVIPGGMKFLQAIAETSPDLSRTDLLWRFHFIIGAMSHVMAAEPLLTKLFGGAIDPTDVDGLTHRLVAFAAGGLRAPVSHHEPALENSHA